MNGPMMVVFKKELREMFRDKRVRTGAFIMPMVIIAMIMTLFGFIVSSVGKPENTKIHVIKSDSPILDALRKAKFKIIEVDSVEAGQKLVRDGAARLVLKFGVPAADGRETIDAYLDPKAQTGQIAFTQLQSAIDKANKEALGVFLKSRDLPTSAMETIKLERHEVLVGEKGSAGEFIVSILPYLIVMWAFYGGMSIASDLVAGEKDKATLETLLITPVRRTQIVLGKFLALATVCLLSSFSTVMGLAIVAAVKPPGTAELLKNGGGVTPLSVLYIILLMLPTTFLFSSSLIAVSSYAKNPREAQTYMTSLSFVVVLPGLFSQFIGLTDYGTKWWINLVPILNTANNVRNALLGKSEFVPMIVTIAVSTALAAIALAFTVKLFNREEVLVRV